MAIFRFHHRIAGGYRIVIISVYCVFKKTLCNNGGGEATTYPPLYFVDYIDLSSFHRPAIFKKAAEIYKEGYSLREVSQRTDIPKSSIRKMLREGRVDLKPHPKGQRGKGIGTAPYGYVWVLGELMEEQKEQKIIQLLLHHWQSGKKFSNIAALSNRQKVRPRMAEKWDGGTIRKIVLRAQKSRLTQI